MVGLVHGILELGEQGAGNKSVSEFSRGEDPAVLPGSGEGPTAPPDLSVEECLTSCLLASMEAFPHQRESLPKEQQLTMFTTFAITRMKMASMAQVFLAQRVRSIHVEKATSFLGKA